MAKNIFDSGLSEVNAVSSGQSYPALGGPQIVKKNSGIAEAVGAGAGLITAFLESRDKEEESEITKEVDKSIDTSLLAADINSEGDISNVADRLEKLKTAANQGRIVTDKFYISLAQESKRLKTQYPDKSSYINKVFKERGITDPRLELLNDIRKVEEKKRDSQLAREEEIISQASKAGIVVFNEDGNPSSGINRSETLKMAFDAVKTQEEKKRVMSTLGYFQTESGELKPTLRLNYVKLQPALRSATFNEALVGIRPAINEIQGLLRTGDLTKVGDIKRKIDDVIVLADQFRLQQKADSVVLNKAEQEDHMAFVDGLIKDMTQGLLGAKESNDINVIKSATFVMDWWNKNADVLNAKDSPTISRLMRLSPEFAGPLLSIAKYGKGKLESLGSAVGNDLSTFIDMMPKPSGNSGDGDVKLENSESNFGKDQKESRIKTSTTLQQEFINRGIVASNPEESHTWVQSQAPMYNAHIEQALSSNDYKTIFNQITSTNWKANLNIAKSTHPESVNKISSYAYDVAERNLLNTSRELRTDAGGAIMGQDYNIVYDSGLDSFVVKPIVKGSLGQLDPSSDEYKRAVQFRGSDPRLNTGFSQVPAIKNRLDSLNKAYQFMKEFKDSKPGMKSMSNEDWLNQITSSFGQSVQSDNKGWKKEFNQRTGQDADKLGLSNMPVQIKDDTDWSKLEVGTYFFDPEGKLRRK